MRFPSITGTSLSGTQVRIPQDLPDPSVLLLAFRQGQQRDIDAWIATLGAASVDAVFELPMLGAKWRPFRSVIDGGMAANIADRAVREHTITVYGQIGPVVRALGLRRRDQVYAVVVADGRVHCVHAGLPTEPDDVIAAWRASGHQMNNALHPHTRHAPALHAGLNEPVISATPFLWLQHPIDDAAYFYAALFDGEVLSEDYGQAMQSATIRVAGQTIHLFNAGPYRELTEAFSIMVTCPSQTELDHIWDGLARGGTPTRCGWITDRFGVTWQVIPQQLREWLSDPQRGQEVTRTMLQMVKLDFAPLQAALRGD